MSKKLYFENRAKIDGRGFFKQHIRENESKQICEFSVPKYEFCIDINGRRKFKNRVSCYGKIR